MTDRNIGQHYADVWKRYIAAMDAHATAMDEVHQAERQDGCAAFNSEYTVFDERDSDVFKEVDEKGKEIFDRLVHYAQSAFAPPGSQRLDIDESKLRQEFIGRFADRDRDISLR